MTKIPKTKDGKHELVFPESTKSSGYPFNLRYALAGRRLFEIFNAFDLDYKGAAELDEKYGGRFLSFYPVNSDPENLFGNISLPYTGRIVSSGRKDDPEYEHSNLVGDFYTRPIIPFTHELVGRCSPHTIKPPFKVELHDSIVTDYPLDVDCFGNILSHIGEEDLELLPSEYRHQLSDIVEADNYFSKQMPRTLEETLSDYEQVDFLRALSLMTVLNIRNNAFITRNGRSNLHNLDLYGDEDLKERMFIFASRDLSMKAHDSAVGLCEEYLSEMGMEGED